MAPIGGHHQLGENHRLECLSPLSRVPKMAFQGGYTDENRCGFKDINNENTTSMLCR